MEKIVVENLYKIFGPHPDKAMRLVQQGLSKEEIMEKTRHGVGVVDASFDVKEGEILVIMGLSGSGKSTLVRCINRLIEPTAGKVIVNGEDVTRLSEKELRAFRQRHFGMVFQNFALFPHRTVCRNVEYGLEIQKVDPARAQGGGHAGPGTGRAQGLGGLLPGPAQRRHAAAGRSGPGPGPGCRHHAHGRSLQRAGPSDPPGHAGRTHRPAGKGAERRSFSSATTWTRPSSSATASS